MVTKEQQWNSVLSDWHLLLPRNSSSECGYKNISSIKPKMLAVLSGCQLVGDRNDVKEFIDGIS